MTASHAAPPLSDQPAYQSEASAPDEPARLCFSYTDKTTPEVIQLLQRAGFRVTTTPVRGLVERQLNLGGMTYHGLQEIHSLVAHMTPRINPPETNKP